jgi:hypothetical protein
MSATDLDSVLIQRRFDPGRGLATAGPVSGQAPMLEGLPALYFAAGGGLAPHGDRLTPQA